MEANVKNVNGRLQQGAFCNLLHAGSWNNFAFVPSSSGTMMRPLRRTLQRFERYSTVQIRKFWRRYFYETKWIVPQEQLVGSNNHYAISNVP